MIGGDKKIFEFLRNLFADLSVPEGYGYVGASGAGHFVKMVHNGIEYGMMEAIAEGFSLMKRSPYKFDLHRVANVYLNGSVIESRLIGWLVKAFTIFGINLKAVSGTVFHTGEGAWTIQTAKKLKVPVPVIEQALKMRIVSAKKPSYAGKILTALRNQFGGHAIKKK